MKNARRFLRSTLLLVLGAFTSFCAVAVHGAEHIVSYHSAIDIAADGSMEVVETIRVRAEGVNIRRGIYREFPTRYRDRLGNSYIVDFDVTAVTRDGQPEPWSARRRANGVRVDLGDDAFLAVPAEYEYAIHYRTDRQLGFFPDHDELYWNVTGNGWSFVIDEASATVTLPVAVPAADLAMEAYTGRFGSSAREYEATLADGRGSIRTRSPLAVNEGLTLVMSWPKGVVAELGRAERAGYLLADNRGLLLALLTLAVVAVYMGGAWSKYGRDPAPGVIFPHYEPPAGFSPAAARYIRKMGYDGKALTAAVVDLAVHGYLHISQRGSKYVLARRASTQALATDEQQLFQHLFAAGDTLELDNKNHALIGKAQSRHARELKKAHLGIHFFNNYRFLLPSLLGTAVMFVLIVALNAIVPLVIVIFAFILLAHVVFGWLLRAPTREGRQMLDKLEGFRLYLDVAEKDELNLRNPPEITPELFERFLPFAIALGVEQVWAERFARRLAALQAGQAAAYHPYWYSGQFNPARMGTFTQSVSKGFASAISSAAMPPGTASGRGGGGFSGGGGGGGGGGGR
jgi:uncharacterized membrane protein YgcG